MQRTGRMLLFLTGIPHVLTVVGGAAVQVKSKENLDLSGVRESSDPVCKHISGKREFFFY